MKKMLVVYYSWYNGNTKKIAEELARAKGADLAVIETVKPYTGTYETVIPFMTNGGWPGHVIKDMKAALKGAKVENPMEIRFDSTGGDRQVTPQNAVDEWINSID